jgi:aldehyde dehydrogenase (NAD+)
MNFKTDLNFRKETLIKLLNNIIIQDEIIKALYDDFKSLLLKLS